MIELLRVVFAISVLNAALATSSHPNHNKMVEIMELMLSHNSSDAIHKVPQEPVQDYEIFITPTKKHTQDTQKIKIFVDAENLPEAMMTQESRSIAQASSEKMVQVLPLSIETVGINIDEYQQTNIDKGKMKERQAPSPNKRQTGTTQMPRTTRRTTKAMQKLTEAPKPKPNVYGLGSTLVLSVKEELPLSTLQDEPSYVDQRRPYREPVDNQRRPQRAEMEDPQGRFQAKPQYQEHTDSVLYLVREDSDRPTYQEQPRPTTKRPASVYREQDTQAYSPPEPVVRPQVQRSTSPPPYSREDDPQVYSPPQPESWPSSQTSKTTSQPTYNREPEAQVYSPPDPAAWPSPQGSRRPNPPVYNREDETPTYNREPDPEYGQSAPDSDYGDANRRPSNKPPVYTGFPQSVPLGTSQSRPLQHEVGNVFPASPCHKAFQYEGRVPEEDRWYGNIYVTTDELLIGMRLGITLDRPADLLATWLYEVKSKDNVQFDILELNKRLLPGPAETVRIMVKFNNNYPPPYLQSITLNGRRICPRANYGGQPQRPTTSRRPVYEEQTRRTTTTEYYEQYEPTTRRTTPYPDRRTTENYVQTDNRRTTTIRPPTTESFPRPNPNKVEGTSTTKKRNTATTKPRPTTKTTTPRPAQTQSTSSGTAKPQTVQCGKPTEQPTPLITKGQLTKRGQWPWHAALYRTKGADLVYTCGGSLISPRYVVTAAHCVTRPYSTNPLEAATLVVHLGKFHLNWSEGVLTNQVSEVYVHPMYNSTDFKADLAALQLSTPVQYTNFIRPVCLWDKRNTRIEDLWGKEGTVIGWGYDETKTLTATLMQARMPVVKREECLDSYPNFFAQFTSNLTYCAGTRNGVSVCNGDSGGGMVFPVVFGRDDEVTWYIRGVVSISVSKEDKVCDTQHFIVFTDLAKFLPWLENFV